MVEKLITYLNGTDNYLGKINSNGHVTGSACIVNKNRDKVLLTNHTKLNMWIQLGGHTEEDETVFESSLREGLEESGLEELIPISDDIFDIDVHLFPERANVKAHYHYDIRYLFEADDSKEIIVSDESIDVKWISVNEIDNYTQEESVLRMVRKMVL